MALQVETFTQEEAILHVVQSDFSHAYAEEQIENWQEYARAMLEGIDAAELVKSSLGAVLRNPSHIRLPKRLTTERIAYIVTHADGSEEEATFGMTGMKIRLRTGRRNENAYVFIGIKSRGENDMQDLEIGREVGVFLVEEQNGKRRVTYGNTNRQLPTSVDNNATRMSPLLVENIGRNISSELSRIGWDYTASISQSSLPRRRNNNIQTVSH